MGTFHPIILSGGTGSRLWPVSRQNLPKQFSPLWTPTLFEQTLARLRDFGEPIIVSHRDHEYQAKSFLKKAGLKNTLLSEPIARNTAPAIALASLLLKRKGSEDDIAGVFPSDHLIKVETEFEKALKVARTQAQESGIVTLGIEPDHPSTGFGYIETDPESSGVKKVQSFHEKPDEVTAQGFLDKGYFYWNAGMFIFKVSTVIKAFEKHMPSMWNDLNELNEDFSNIKDVYENVKGQSFDYGIMEHFQETYCVPVDMGWSDVGSWDEVVKTKNEDAELIEHDASGNALIGESKKAAFIGVNDIVAVDSKNALLIYKKGDSQKVKHVYEKLKEGGREDLLNYENIDFRPWGEFEVIRDEPHFKSKIIRVNPGERLSYQSHKKRAEHWVIVKGDAEVVLDDEVIRLKQGESIFIPQGAKHRMRNTTQEVIEFIEVQVGTYFGEDDITRYEDDYSRT